MNRRLGIGIVAYARLDGAKRVIDSILRYAPSSAYVMISIDESNVSNEIQDYAISKGIGVRHNRPRRGSIGNDNDVWQSLYDAGCEHIVMLEDDVAVRSREFFRQLLLAVTTWKLDHVQMRCVYDLFPNVEKAEKGYQVAWGCQNGVKLTFSRAYSNLQYGDWYHTRTELTYVSRTCIETVGYMDTKLGPYSGPGHPDYLLRARRAGMYPWFWYVSIPGVLDTVEWETAGMTTTLTPGEIGTGNANIPKIYRERPIYVPYN